MKANPYCTALMSIGTIGLIVSGIAYFAGLSMGIGGISLLGFAGIMFPLSFVAVIAWLLLEGIDWKETVVAEK
ncbi:hypothetical protein QN357_11260 [Cryobacterium sp. RTC2.1]|uniref:hypothetical protein n=1 Tax=Cryobacterium sp. RTC2.1 TaxID=3048634 RepID=UPI002B224E96|nr:hypothetical protein [Cryobacterium sp. RTC2.1]MEB0003505.1 hypothetical protein [Cryobacterium sp. RTC2.1]